MNYPIAYIGRVKTNPRKEAIMVWMMQFKKENHNALVGVIMVIIAVLFICYMISSLVSNTHEFWLSEVQ